MPWKISAVGIFFTNWGQHTRRTGVARRAMTSIAWSFIVMLSMSHWPGLFCMQPGLNEQWSWWEGGGTWGWGSFTPEELCKNRSGKDLWIRESQRSKFLSQNNKKPVKNGRFSISTWWKKPDFWTINSITPNKRRGNLAPRKGNIPQKNTPLEARPMWPLGPRSNEPRRGIYQGLSHFGRIKVDANVWSFWGVSLGTVHEVWVGVIMIFFSGLKMFGY